MSVMWIPTDKHVYGAIYREHYKDLRPFSSCTAPSGDLRLGISNPYMDTEWGFRTSDEPLIKLVQTKESIDQKEYDCEYFIAIVKHEEY